jgi:His/Glu/Gln/Arg/opine family amino acid ABC transporter permease subunit
MFDFTATLAQSNLFLQGAAVTLTVSLLGAALGVLFGSVLFFARRSSLAPLRYLAEIYVSVVRGTPLLVQIFLVYYALPSLIGVDLPAFSAGVLALSLNSGAFVSEILRGGLTAIAKGQFEAGLALGLPRLVVWLRIVLPQLFRMVLPPLVNEFTILVKASPLLSVITIVELTRTAQNIMNVTYRPIEAFSVAAAFYFVILFTLSGFARALERRVAVRAA